MATPRGASGRAQRANRLIAARTERLAIAMPARLADFAFELGLVFYRALPGVTGARDAPTADGLYERARYVLIGRLAQGAPFWLTYSEVGVVQWVSPEHLGEAMRRKILARVRTDIRRAAALPPYLVAHDLRALDRQDSHAGHAEVARLEGALWNEVWRARYLDDRDDDYVLLTVPFAEKDAAKALGAKWNPERRAWWVRRQPDMAAFARWLPGTVQGGAP